MPTVPEVVTDEGRLDTTTSGGAVVEPAVGWDQETPYIRTRLP